MSRNFSHRSRLYDKKFLVSHEVWLTFTYNKMSLWFLELLNNVRSASALEKCVRFVKTFSWKPYQPFRCLHNISRVGGCGSLYREVFAQWLCRFIFYEVWKLRTTWTNKNVLYPSNTVYLFKYGTFLKIWYIHKSATHSSNVAHS